jgi:chaperone required for assembly of F1-ATPase
VPENIGKSEGMRELFEDRRADNPVAAARRAVRPLLRRRFYEAVTIAAGEGGQADRGAHAVCLDGKPIHTPGRRALAAPVPELARALADEWAAQSEYIDPAKMPLTRLANTIIDGVGAARPQVAAEVRKYLASDLLFYRAESPAPLRARQAQQWDPLLAWARQALGADFRLATGIAYVAQPAAALEAAGAALAHDPWRLGALHASTTLTGSALIALALMHGAVTPDAAWHAAHVDEDWNMEQWGRDEIALERRAFRFAEFKAAALVLRILGKD